MAKKKIYELDTHSSIVDTDVVAISAGASGNAEKSTAAALKSYVKTGLTTADVAASTDKNYVTDAEKVVISATSGTNTGDQDLSPYEQKSNKKTSLTDNSDIYYPTQKAVKTVTDAKQDTLVSGTNIKTVNGNSLLGSGNINIAGAGDVSGPASSTADHIPQFSDTTGKVLKDGLGVVTTIGSPGADTNIPTEQAVREAISSAGGGDVTGPASSTNNNVAMFNGITGKLLKDSGVSLSGSNTGDETQSTIKTKLGAATASVDGYATATQITKLDGIATGATANTKATGAEVDTGTDDTKYVTAKAMNDSGYLSSMSDVTAASDTAAGKVELATSAETSTGTDATRAVTPDGLAGSTIFGRKGFTVIAVDSTTDVSAADGKAYVVIPECMNGMNLVRANAVVNTAGTTNATTIDIYNVTDSHDMLSTAISIASGGTVGTAGTVDTSYDDVATNDILRIDVTTASTTKPKGLIVVLEFQLA